MKKKLMIDMDDTITSGGVLDMVNEYLGSNYEEKDVNSYYVQSLIPEEMQEGFSDFFYERNMYKYTKLNPNVIEVLEYLNNKFDIYILSAYILKDSPNGASNHLRNKYNYLRETFPFLDPYKFIFTCDKSMVSGDIVIDDLAYNLYPQYEIKILFDSYHNKEDNMKDKDGVIRAKSWLEIKDILDSIIMKELNK